MKTIVTGGCGFIGSHLAERLVNEGHDITIIDNISTGRLQNIDHIKNKIKLIQLDCSDYHKIEKYFIEVDWVFHLAALADIVPSIIHPLKYHHSNIDGTISVLEASRKHNVKRFIYAASSSCYGIPDNYPTSEEADIRPQYPYAVTKYLGEQYVMYWHQIYDLPTSSLRFFNVYGPRSRTSGTYGAVLGVFLKQKLEGEPFTVVGTGEQTRDFTFVTDVVNACTTTAENVKAIGQIMNVGSGNTYSVNYLVKLLGGEKIHIPKRPGEPDCTFADIKKIRDIIRWEPKVTFEEGVRIMIEHIDYWKDAPLWNPDSISEATKDWFRYLGK